MKQKQCFGTYGKSDDEVGHVNDLIPKAVDGNNEDIVKKIRPVDGKECHL